MKFKQDRKTLAGLAIVACLTCLVGPIVAFLAAIGIGSAVGYALFGGIGLTGGALAAIYVARRRQVKTRSHPKTPETAVSGLTN